MGQQAPVRPSVNEGVWQVPGFEASQSDAWDVRLGEDGVEQRREAPAAVVAIPADMDPGEDDLAVALVVEAADLIDDLFDSTAALLAPCLRHDAEAAAVSTAVLDLDECAGARSVRMDRRPGFGGSPGCSGRVEVGDDPVHQSILVGVGDDEIDASERGSLARLKRGKAPGEDDVRARVHPVERAGSPPGGARRLGGDRTGIQHRHVGVLNAGDRRVPQCTQLTAPQGDLGLVESAAELVEKDLHRAQVNRRGGDGARALLQFRQRAERSTGDRDEELDGVGAGFAGRGVWRQGRRLRWGRR